MHCHAIMIMASSPRIKTRACAQLSRSTDLVRHQTCAPTASDVKQSCLALPCPDRLLDIRELPLLNPNVLALP
jgi:hypothetical protein